MLILCDFDGTVTSVDTNSFLASRFAPEAQQRVAGALAARTMTLREVLEAELGAMTAGRDAIVAAAVKAIPFRAHFHVFLDDASSRGDRVVLLSAGFRQLIVPMLDANGVDPGGVELIANDIDFTASGGVITWRDLPVCTSCGEECKRSDVARMRAMVGDGEQVVYIGDGFSDRCGAETADRIFARGSLAAYLDGIDVGYEWFDDFRSISAALSG